MNDVNLNLPRPEALLAAGVAAAVLVVGNPVGLGTIMSAVAVAAAVVAQVPRPLGGATVMDAALALLLAATTTATTGRWMLALTLPAALYFASLALAGGRSWGEVLTAPLAPLRATRDALPTFWTSLGERLGANTPHRNVTLLRGVGLALVLVTVFGTLFVSADRAFAELTERYLLPHWNLRLLPVRVGVGALVALGGAALTAAPLLARREAFEPAQRQLTRAEWLTALGALDLLFAAFVAVQVAVLFGGHTHVLETAGLTYAEYARQGFFQLLVVAGLTLAVIAGSVRWARCENPHEVWILRILLGVLCLLTLVVVISALRRLDLYEQAFGFTRARMLAHGILLWFAALFLLLIGAGVRRQSTWLPRSLVWLTGIALLACALLHPDALVAKHNVARWSQTGLIDLAYLDGLSADAIPALAKLPPRLRSCVLTDDVDHLHRPEPWHAFNLSRHRARQILNALDLGVPCQRR
ncbi:MAG: DUF4153 domain-containing protein [Nitriliruptorales bacterium]